MDQSSIKVNFYLPLELPIFDKKALGFEPLGSWMFFLKNRWTRPQLSALLYNFLKHSAMHLIVHYQIFADVPF